MEQAQAIDGQDQRRKGRTLVVVWQVLVLAGLVEIAVATSDAQQWAQPELVGALTVLTIGSHLFPLDARSVRISGAFMGLVLSMAVLGPAPAAAIGAAAVAIDAVFSRPCRVFLVSDLVTYTAFPLAGGIAITAVAGEIADRGDMAFAAVVAGVFLMANFLNFSLIVGQLRLHRLRREPFARLVRRTYLPVLPWELAAAFVTAVVAYGYQQLGVAVVGLLCVLLFVFQLLLRAVLQAEQRGEDLATRLDDLALMHEGLMAVMMQTLSLRDPMTARHSAAVARYAREVAAAAGLSERDQNLAHTAGLVHDIGKAAFSDSLLTSPQALSDADRAAIRRHPDEGARILRRVKGYDEVAEIVRAHHERVDGQGYPLGLAGDEIPVLSRIVAVVDAYDAMTARDSYREPVTHELALAELRRVAGTQLDIHLVEVFVGVLEAGVEFAHADDRDLEAELSLESARPAAGFRPARI